MLKALLPKGAPFFEYLLKQNEVLCSICALVPCLIGGSCASEFSCPEEADIRQRAATLEEGGDKIYLKLIRNLSQTFITPIDREDILRIAKETEATVDLLQNLVARLYVLQVGCYPFAMGKLAQNMCEMVVLTNSMLKGLSQKKDSHDTRAFRALLDECEMLISSGLGEVLDVAEMTPQAIMTSMKLCRAYDRLEQAVRQITDLVEAIEEAVLKNV